MDGVLPTSHMKKRIQAAKCRLNTFLRHEQQKKANWSLKAIRRADTNE